MDAYGLIINAGTATNFTIDLGALEGELFAGDGQPVQPVRGSRFPMAIRQRVDLMLSLPNSVGAYPVLARREGERERSGIIILATRGASVVRVPAGAEGRGPVVDSALELQLRALKPLTDRRPERRVTVELVGDMANYIWGLRESTPLTGLKLGDRIEVVLSNKTPMPHPMMQVAGGETVAIAFDAGNPGRWAFHCHNLYHMAAGMITTIAYEGVG